MQGTFRVLDTEISRLGEGWRFIEYYDLQTYQTNYKVRISIHIKYPYYDSYGIIEVYHHESREWKELGDMVSTEIECRFKAQADNIDESTFKKEKSILLRKALIVL